MSSRFGPARTPHNNRVGISVERLSVMPPSLGQALLPTAVTRADKPTRNNLNTINGCYIPCLLNILGAPLFLFVGFSVGMLGWVGALGLFCFSELIAYLTIGSFSALVTNGRMRGGGAYYMISRSLGPALGGSSGLLFWFTYCVNVTFNTSAFTDTVFATWFPEYVHCTLEAAHGHCWYKVAFSTATLFVLFLIAYKGAGAFAKVNYFIFAGLVVALVVAIGSVWFSPTSKLIVDSLADLQYVPDDLAANLTNVTISYRPWAWERDCPEDLPGSDHTSWCNLGLDKGGGNFTYGLKTTMFYHPAPSGQCDMRPHATVGTLCDLPHVFSFVFPAVVGMMEGANLSGDLKDPGRSIPLGTIAAVSTAFVCYILLILGQVRSNTPEYPLSPTTWSTP
jgi:potassium/chloride transporter 9